MSHLVFDDSASGRGRDLTFQFPHFDVGQFSSICQLFDKGGESIFGIG